MAQAKEDGAAAPVPEARARDRFCPKLGNSRQVRQSGNETILPRFGDDAGPSRRRGNRFRCRGETPNRTD